MEIYTTSAKTLLDETDLSLRKIEELHVQLQALEKQKVISGHLGNPATFLHAYTCLPLAYATRQAADAILQDVADTGVVYLERDRLPSTENYMFKVIINGWA
uniref:Putative vacuolar fusion protein MON1 n=1 Tax=Helianthus annuus TaxID=4232 RepID=A0A251UK51_HELAN